MNLPLLNTVTDVQSFWGFTTYYLRITHHYIQISSHLNALIFRENASKRICFDWMSEGDQTFKQLKDLYKKSPILACVDYSSIWVRTHFFISHTIWDNSIFHHSLALQKEETKGFNIELNI